MNDTRRKAIAKLVEQFNDLRSSTESIQEEEQEYFDNMPEALQGGEKGEKAESAIDALEEALSSIDEAIVSLETAQE